MSQRGGHCLINNADPLGRSYFMRFITSPTSTANHGSNAPLCTCSLALECASVADRVTRAMTSSCSDALPFTIPIPHIRTLIQQIGKSLFRFFDNRFSLFGLAFCFFHRVSLATVMPTLLLTLFLFVLFFILRRELDGTDPVAPCDCVQLYRRRCMYDNGMQVRSS